jgi:hypothetical protein
MGVFGWRATRVERLCSSFLEQNGSALCLEVRMKSFQFSVWLVEYEWSHHIYH